MSTTRGGRPLTTTVRHVAAAAVALAVAAGVALPGGGAAIAADATPVDREARLLFTTGAVPPCAICHTLKDAGSTGAIGPVLDELQPDSRRVATALRTGIGAMPSYKATLSDAQIVRLARYVAKASGGER